MTATRTTKEREKRRQCGRKTFFINKMFICVGIHIRKIYIT